MISVEIFGITQQLSFVSSYFTSEITPQSFLVIAIYFSEMHLAMLSEVYFLFIDSSDQNALSNQHFDRNDEARDEVDD